MPSPTLGGLTLAPGDYSRVCKQTVPSARAFSPHLFERLFCQAGVIRRGTRREGCVRDKQEAQKPTIALGSGFKPPHSRLQRKKDNRGLRPRGTLYFLTAKSTKNSPADAFAYFVPANVRNGRLFAGLQANRPRFLPLLAGTSFHSFGIGPESFAAFRGGKDASGTSRKHRSLRSPLEAVSNRRILACSGRRTTVVFARGVLCTF